METQLNLSSPIVRRVLRLRERMAQEAALMTPSTVEQQEATTAKSYQWQMWQKSDLSAYAEDEPEYRCKG